MKKVMGVIEEITQLRNSRNGNSRWKIELDSGNVYQTETDSAVNPKLGYSWQGRVVEAVLNGQGKIFQLEEI